MKNLAGQPDCDKTIISELEQAEINIKEVQKTSGEVPYSITGIIKTPHGDITLTRSWYYWVANGKIPLKLAQKFYTHPEGKKSIRVSGHCLCPPPEEWTTYYDNDGKILGHKTELIGHSEATINNVLQNPKYRFVDDIKKEGKPFVDLYHIDSQAGLLLFSQYLNEKIK